MVSCRRSILAASVTSASRAPTRCDRSSDCDMADAKAAAPPFFFLSSNTPGFLRGWAPAATAPAAEEDDGDDKATSRTGRILRPAGRDDRAEDPPPPEATAAAAAAAAFPLFKEVCMVVFKKLNTPPPPPLVRRFDELSPDFDFLFLFAGLRFWSLPPASSFALRWSKPQRSGRTRIGTGREMPCYEWRNGRNETNWGGGGG